MMLNSRPPRRLLRRELTMAKVRIRGGNLIAYECSLVCILVLSQKLSFAPLHEPFSLALLAALSQAALQCLPGNPIFGLDPFAVNQRL